MTTTTVPVGTLTDAELDLLTRPRTRVGPRPVMPVWSRLDRDRRTAEARRALASLVSRQLLDPGDAGGLRRDLRSLLALRAAASAVAAVARVSPGGRDHWFAHVAHGVVVVEQVSADGRHRFALTAVVTLPEVVAAAVLHPAAADGCSGPLEEADDWLRSDLELRTRTSVRRWAWVSGPAGTWQVRPGRVAGTAEPAGPDDVRRVLQQAVADLGEVGDAG